MLTDPTQLARLLDHLGVAVYSVTADTSSVCYINPAMETLFGRPAEEFRADPRLWLAAIDPNDRPIVGDPAAEALSLGSARHLYRIVRPDGSCRWVLDQTRRIDDARGRPDRLDCAFTDVTRRMEIERTLRDDASLLRQLGDCAPVGILLQDGTGRLSYANPQARLLLGDVVGMSLEEQLALVHPDDRDRLCNSISAASSPRLAQRVEFRVARPDGEIRWVLVTRMEVREEDGTPLGFVEAVHDITDAWRAEAALRKREYEYRSVIENIQDTFFRADAEGRLLMTSPSAALMFRYASTAEMAGMSLASFWCDLAERARGIASLATQGGVRDLEVRLRRKDGTTFDAAVTAQACFAEDGTRVGTEGIVRDITERKRTQEALRALPQQIMRAQEEERRAIARELHDAVIQQVVALKLRCDEGLRGRPSPGCSSPWAQVPPALDDIIRQLRGIATSLRPPSLDLLGLAAAVRSWVNRAADAAGVGVSVEIDCPDLRLAPNGDIHCFRVVQEAVTNALLHGAPRRLAVHLHQTDGELVISVVDDGCGFELSEVRSRATQSGHVGLSVMEERVAALGGKIDITSAPGHGTTVRARLPLGQWRDASMP